MARAGAGVQSRALAPWSRPAQAFATADHGNRLMLRIALSLLLVAGAAAAEEVSVEARSEGYRTLCAEMDNVLIAMESPEVRRFTISARHPHYLAGWEGDSMAADFTNCVFPEEPIWETPDTFDKVLHEDDRVVLRGIRSIRTWRPENVPVQIVGGGRFDGVQLTQLHVKRPGGLTEVLVLYPQDGYWRPRPLPPAGRDETGFGSSLIIGPIEVDRRPLVKMREITFDPATLTYRLDFVAGGSATVRVASVSREETRLEVAFDGPVAGGPFAMLSSMHVAPDNSDVSVVSARPAGQPFWARTAVGGFEETTGAEFLFGRQTPSRHNYSAPDIQFGPFSTD
jgi:hypothetical protein